MRRVQRFFGVLMAIVCFFGVLSFTSCKKSAKVYTRYEITAEYVPESRSIAGTAKVTFENTGEGEFSVLKFQLYPNAYRQNALYQPVSSVYKDSAYYDGESYGEITISSVHGSKNWEVMGEDKNILYVYLERSLFPGDRVVLDIGFITKLATVNHRTGVTKQTVNLGNFYPILCGFKNGGFYESVYYSDGEPFYSDCADYKLSLTLPKEYEAAASGRVVSERMLESKRVYSFEAEKVRDFACVLSESFRVEKTQVNGTAIS